MITHKSGNCHLFKCILKVDLSKDRDRTSVIFPERYNVSDFIAEKADFITQSIDFQNSKRSDCAPYTDTFECNGKSGKIKKYFAYVINSDNSILILVSKYFHQRLLLWILGQTANVFSAFHSIPFVVDHTYNFSINPPSDLECPDLCFQDMSQMSEISTLRMFFLSNFPPFYMFHIISYLFRSFKIIVISSSVRRLTDTVFAISSLLYPLNSSTFIIPTIPVLHRREIDKIRMSGPCIIGLHTTIIQALESLNTADSQDYNVIFNADVPYITVSKPKTQSSFQQSISTKEKKTALEMLIRESHLSTVNLAKQFKSVFPAYHIQMKICEYTISMLKLLFDASSEDLAGIKDSLHNAKEKFQDNSVFQGNSLCSAFLSQLKRPDLELKKLYFPKESNMPLIAVPQLPTDFINLSPDRSYRQSIRK